LRGNYDDLEKKREKQDGPEISWDFMDEGVILKYRECIVETSYSDRSM
jgi:hypothetical protein